MHNTRTVIALYIYSGKRLCPGESLARQIIFVFLTGLLQNFDVRPLEGQDKVKYKEYFNFNIHPLPFELRLIERA